MIKTRRLRRMLVPTAALSGSAVVTLVGVLMFALGLVLSFRVAAAAPLQWLGDSWNSLMSDAFGMGSVSRANHFAGGMLLVLGVTLAVTGIRTGLRKLMRVLNPSLGSRVTSEYFRRQQLALGPRVVALGGGTGLSTLLRGLKRHTSNITAIVTVTDDGGSSGRLSQELGIIPPGDIRACLVALADAEKQVTDIFQYRFRGQSGSLSGHSLGNLLIAGLIDLNGGDFERALQMASEVLAIRGRVMPSTLNRVRLRATLDNGSEICGETAIAESHGRIRRIFLDPGDCRPFPEALQAIEDAELIVIGPGSVYTSVIPNLLVPGIGEAIRSSTAKKVYVCNVMTQPGESDAFTACEHVLAIESNTDTRLFDYVLLNNQLPSHDMLERYQASDQYPVEADIDRIRSMNLKVITGDFMSESDYVRHDPSKVADALIKAVSK